MNNGTQELTAAARSARTTTTNDELDTLKRELMKAEVRLAKARATVVSAEIDIKVLSAKLRAATR
jgi:DnaJ-domain-containing protein 1